MFNAKFSENDIKDKCIILYDEDDPKSIGILDYDKEKDWFKVHWVNIRNSRVYLMQPDMDCWGGNTDTEIRKNFSPLGWIEDVLLLGVAPPPKTKSELDMFLMLYQLDEKRVKEIYSYLLEE